MQKRERESENLVYHRSLPSIPYFWLLTVYLPKPRPVQRLEPEVSYPRRNFFLLGTQISNYSKADKKKIFFVGIDAFWTLKARVRVRLTGGRTCDIREH